MKKILIVEDDHMLSMINKKYIESIGHRVVAAVTNALDAIEAAREHQPDIILMDIRLDGDMDGIDAMVEIAKFSDVPAIYLTGNSDAETRKRAEATNMAGFFVKPIHFEQLKKFFSEY